MFSISKHLKALFLEHNCVIIPDLGGFVAQYVPAHYDKDNHQFLPPARKVAFNADLTMNDGLLVQSLMQVYDATFPEMQKAVEDKVSDMKDRLFSVGEYLLTGIGRLTLNVDGRIVFEPTEDDIVSPEFFGLEMLDDLSTQERTETTHLTRGLIRKEGNGYVVRIHRSVANIAAAAVCAIFCFFSWTATPNQPTTSTNEAKLFATSWQQPTATPQSQKAVSKKPVKVVAANAQTTKATTVSTTAVTAEAPYTIILAQGITEASAQNMAEGLKADGLTEALAVDEGSYYGVHYARFATYEEASQFLRVHKGDSHFAQGWIRQVK